jgi:glutaminyl-peptide cyclotransferase
VWYGGRLFESTGRYGQSDVRELNPLTGQVLQRTAMPERFFGEGLAALSTGELRAITWREQTYFSYRSSDLKQTGTGKFQSGNSQGWGLTFDGTALWLTDGSSKLFSLDPVTMKALTVVNVQLDGRGLSSLNELEWVLGEVLANVWHKDYIARIDPSTGAVLGLMDMTAVGIPPLAAENVLNGIACDSSTVQEEEGVRCFVTGKLWDRMHEIRLHTVAREASSAR